MAYFQVRYNSRVVIYDCKAFTRLTTGLVVMGGDSCLEGREFESHHHVLDGHFSHIFVEKCSLFEKMKIHKKRPGDGPFFYNFAATSRWLVNQLTSWNMLTDFETHNLPD